ncbi:NAD(+) diphosphatase [Longispora albida]|uniref:NAD(+) diphosphatase n=1 Tax=Longispora albida TaxID=203523 RepID=UPI00035C6620|nr:NAD(+) diphosphatase [Longispora albida]
MNSRLLASTEAPRGPVTGDWLLTVSGDRVTIGSVGARGVPGELLFLGTFDGVPAWAEESAADGGATWRELAATLDQETLALAGRALQLVTWRRTHRYCGACREELAYQPGYSWPRCSGCDLLVPMQLSTAVIVLIRRGDEVLLARHSYGPAKTMWALIAGFTEYGETLEDAARREVREETGLEITNLAYAGSQPWSMAGPGQLLVGFTADWAAGVPTVDGAELTAAEWFPLDALPAEVPPHFSIARWLLDAAVAGERRGPVPERV